MIFRLLYSKDGTTGSPKQERSDCPNSEVRAYTTASKMKSIDQFRVVLVPALTLTVRIRSNSRFSSSAGRLLPLMSRCARWGNPFFVKIPRECSVLCAPKLFWARFRSISDVSTSRELDAGCCRRPSAGVASPVTGTSSRFSLERATVVDEVHVYFVAILRERRGCLGRKTSSRGMPK